MCESRSSNNTQVLAICRKLPLTGYHVIGYYATAHDVKKGFRRHRLTDAILF